MLFPEFQYIMAIDPNGVSHIFDPELNTVISKKVYSELLKNQKIDFKLDDGTYVGTLEKNG